MQSVFDDAVADLSWFAIPRGHRSGRPGRGDIWSGLELGLFRSSVLTTCS